VTAGLHTLSCVSFGVGFRLRADSELLLPAMLECAPLGTQSLRVEGPGDIEEFTLWGLGSAGYRLVVCGEVVAEAAEVRAVLEKLTGDLMVYVANHAPDRVFVHAGVVGWRDCALVLPGTSFAGKTTMVAALVRAGATYYSDEYAVLDERGCVHPYARDLQMREAGSAEQVPVPVGELGGRAGTAPLAVSHIVFTEYAESGRWDPQPVSAGMAVLEMLRHTIPVQRTPARVMATLGKMMETATALRSGRGEADETARLLLDGIDARV